MMHLVTLALPIGSHLGGWRHPDAYEDSVASLEAGIHLAELAERGKFDLLFLADGNGVRALDKPALFAANTPTNRPGWFEPLTYLSAIAMKTRNIGLVATATTTYEEPYILARKFASLDLLSGGRAGWNVVTTSMAEDALNFSRSAHVPRDERYERAREFVDVCFRLWNSWAPDAFVHNKETGQYLNPDRVHATDHQGKHFQIKGPLNVSRSPQDRPLIFSAGQSEDGRELSAKSADCVFAHAKTKELAIELYSDIKGRMAKYGRKPESLRIIPGAMIYLGRTRAEADALYEEMNAYITPALGLDYLSKQVHMDLSGYDVDGPMPKIEGEIVGMNSGRLALGEMAEREGLSIRQMYERYVPSMGHPVFRGDAKDIADQMEDWYKSGACDGFMVQFPAVPLGLEGFVDQVVPILQERGLMRLEYSGKTLRENLNLPAPADALFDPA